MQASLLSSQSGFDAVFFARTHFKDGELRRAAAASEVVWAPGRHLFGEDSDVFAGTFPNHYGPPQGFNFDWGQRDPPIQVRVQADDLLFTRKCSENGNDRPMQQGRERTTDLMSLSERSAWGNDSDRLINSSHTG